MKIIILLELHRIFIQYSIRACILFPYIAYTRDDLYRIVRDNHSVLKGARPNYCWKN